MAQAVVRHDWYQTDEKIVLTVLYKNAAQKNCKVSIGPDEVSLNSDDYSLLLPLLKPIDVEKSSHKITPLKVEINLTKLTGERWTGLTKVDEAKAEEKVDTVPNIYKKDWDTLAKEIELRDKEENKKHEQVNELFQKIYQDSSPEVRKAMNKSFTESNGTVLSTNWSEIQAKKVETKPPDGTEFKTWDK